MKQTYHDFQTLRSRPNQTKKHHHNTNSNPVIRQLLNDELSDLDGENDPDYKSQSDIETQSDDSTNSFSREILNTELVLLKNEAKFSLKQLTFYEESTLPVKRFSYGQRLTNLPVNELSLIRNGKYLSSIPLILQVLNDHDSSIHSLLGVNSRVCSRHVSQIKIQMDTIFQLIFNFMIMHFNNDNLKDNVDDYWELINVFKSARVWSTSIIEIYSKLKMIDYNIRKKQKENIRVFDLPFLRRIQELRSMNLIENRNLASNKRILSYFEPYIDPFFVLKSISSFPIPRYKYVIFSPSEDRLFGIGLKIFGRTHLKLIRKHFLPHRSINEIRKRKASLSRSWELYQEKFHPFHIWKTNCSRPFKDQEDFLVLQIMHTFIHKGIYDLRNIIIETKIARDFYMIFKRLLLLLENISKQIFLYGFSEPIPIEQFLKEIFNTDTAMNPQQPENLYSNSLENSLHLLEVVSKELDLIPYDFFPRYKLCRLPAEIELEPLALAITKLERYITGEFNNTSFIKIGCRDIRI